ncbi:MAG: hypothetical protein QM811_25430 [Pirellulales bacterium]
MGEQLERELRAAFADDPRVVEIRRYGLLAGVEFVPLAAAEESDPHSPSDAVRTGRALLRAARARGLTSRTHGATFQLAPPFSATDDDVRRVVAIVRDAADATYGIS